MNKTIGQFSDQTQPVFHKPAKEENDMKNTESVGIKNRLIPYILFPMMTGILTGVLIFLFKISASSVMHFSERIYQYVRENPIYLPLLVLGVACIGAVSALILRFAKECRGGGIPTAVASIRGLLPLQWVQGVFVLFGSALLTFLAGVPLGNEGPSVQMATAVGAGNARLRRRRKAIFERYLMTGGACSGFAIATGAPLSGIMFALEEAHRRFSTALFMVASISVLTGTVTYRYLCFFFNINTTFFDISITRTLPAKFFWVAIIIGAVCGVCSILFTKLYRVVNQFSKTKAGKIPFHLKLIIIFGVTALFGFISANFVGTGHELIELILHRKTVWYAIICVLVIRALLMIVANNEGVSGGMFVPNLAFGAMLASLIADGLIALNIIDGVYYTILIVVGMASFLAASSRTPITAVTFSAEALCISTNILPVIFGVVVSYIIAELFDKTCFTETVIESRVEHAHQGKKPVIVYSYMTVQKGSFADGMETRDILWPPTCTILSIDKKLSPSIHRGMQELREGDVLHLHYQTYEPEQTMKMLISILGDQRKDKRNSAHLGSDDHLVPLD
jgi:H+/Cl- antiporter ClcA